MLSRTSCRCVVVTFWHISNVSGACNSLMTKIRIRYVTPDIAMKL